MLGVRRRGFETSRSPATAGIALAGRAATVVGSTGGGFNPGNTFFYDDYSGASIARASANKVAWALARGYGSFKDEVSEPNRAFGWFYTQQPSDLPAVVSATFPFPSNRALMVEAHPQANFTQPDQKQTDFYIGLDNIIPAAHWGQMWIMFIDDSATTNTMPSTWSNSDKLLYYANVFPGGFFLVTGGYRGWQHHDPSYSGAERAAFEAGTVPKNECYFALTAHGETGTNGEPGRLVSTNDTEAPAPDLFHNINKKHWRPNVWTLAKWHVDCSTPPNGVFGMWLRERGETSFTEIIRVPHTGVSWPIDASMPASMTSLHIPTTQNAEPLNASVGTGSGRQWKLVAELALSLTEGGLPTYAE